jgi:Ca2+-transporting ATPase
MAASGLRVLAVAYRPLPVQTAIDEFTETGLEEGLILAGLVGMSDPPRPEVVQAVMVCRQAGVRVCMITGDHPATALAVAKELHLLDPGLPDERQMLTGRELDRLSARVLARRVEDVRVYARVSPGHKLRIVRALRSHGQVVAMTGDGVNDAPAVREADIGVAMGLTGTAVTKEASDMILTDDNFASIVAALEEGRTIYDNIRRSIRYLLSCNTGEILTMLIGALFHLPLPLLPLQILWVNLVTDGLPAMALGLQAPEADVSTRPPRSPREGVFARGLGVKILGRGIIIGLSTIGVYVLALRVIGWDLLLARTVAFATLVLSQLVHAFDCRSERRALVEVPLSSNWYLVVAALVSLAMLLGVIYIPELRPFFKTAPLGSREWTWVVLASVWGQIAVGCLRLTYRRRHAGRTAATSRQRRCQEPGPR